MQIADFYRKYNLMPGLATHQLRVGGIVKLIINEHDAIVNALLHDMGNLAKFQLVDNEWIEKQKIFRDRYGSDANEATYKILEESGLQKYAQYMREEGRFYQTIETRDDYSDVSIPALLTLYADCRVAIDGVTSLENRILDLEIRYEKHRNDRAWAFKLENYVQTLTHVDIKKISEADVEPLSGELLTYSI